jgi:hypothetical protein
MHPYSNSPSFIVVLVEVVVKLVHYEIIELRVGIGIVIDVFGLEWWWWWWAVEVGWWW